ncbi:MAG: translation elongation factor Ts, partial [Actinobacteria bacterium]|nr:translation elongation factor Ts [Actinomycetota bacterium]
MSFTAQDVKALRESTGAGMMDCKKALEETGGDLEAAKQFLREKGLAASAKRDDRENNQGVVAISVSGGSGAIVQLKSETDFVAGSDQFKAEADALVSLVLADGPEAVAARNDQLEELKILLKEKIELGEVVRMQAADGNVLGHYEHIQGGRGVNAVLVEMSGASDEMAHDVAVHIAFARPRYLR